jgi:hypothetical protein
MNIVSVAEYLQHTSCYRGMSRDWDSCADRFMGLVREETSRKNVSEHTKLIGLCWYVMHVFYNTYRRGNVKTGYLA